MSTDASIRQKLPGSVYADAAAALLALQTSLPMLEAAVRDPAVCGSGFLHVVVLDPSLTPAEVEFERAIILEHSIGDRERWDADYAGFARAKARLSWLRNGDSSQIHAGRPHCLREGDSLLGGGVWLDGIVVGVSGAFPWYDEAFALAIAAQLRATARARLNGALLDRELFVSRTARAAHNPPGAL